MVNIIINNPEGEPSNSTAAVTPSSADPSVAGAVAQSHATKKDFNIKSTVGSLAELREKAPDVYKKMMEGVAFRIVSEMREHQERLKEMMRKADRDAKG